MDASNAASIVVAIVAALAAWAAQRSAAKASMTNTNTTSRTDMEKEAYDRARAFDTETIKRQDEEIKELRSDNERLHREVKALRLRISRLERGFPQNLEEALREKLDDSDPTISE